jgi:hypothetical protein
VKDGEDIRSTTLATATTTTASTAMTGTGTGGGSSSGVATRGTRSGTGTGGGNPGGVSGISSYRDSDTHTGNSFSTLRYGQSTRDSRSKRLAAISGSAHQSPYHYIDFSRLEMRSLLRYKRHFKLPIRPQASKSELVEAVMDHYRRPLILQQSSSGRDSMLHDHGLPHNTSVTSSIATSEPDTLAAFLHVTHRYIKIKEKERKDKEKLNQ